MAVQRTPEPWRRAVRDGRAQLAVHTGHEAGSCRVAVLRNLAASRIAAGEEAAGLGLPGGYSDRWEGRSDYAGDGGAWRVHEEHGAKSLPAVVQHTLEAARIAAGNEAAQPGLPEGYGGHGAVACCPADIPRSIPQQHHSDALEEGAESNWGAGRALHVEFDGHQGRQPDPALDDDP